MLEATSTRRKLWTFVNSLVDTTLSSARHAKTTSTRRKLWTFSNSARKNSPRSKRRWPSHLSQNRDVGEYFISRIMFHHLKTCPLNLNLRIILTRHWQIWVFSTDKFVPNVDDIVRVKEVASGSDPGTYLATLKESSSFSSNPLWLLLLDRILHAVDPIIDES